MFTTAFHKDSTMKINKKTVKFGPAAVTGWEM